MNLKRLIFKDHAKDSIARRYPKANIKEELKQAIQLSGQYGGDEAWKCPCGAVVIVTKTHIVKTILTYSQYLVNVSKVLGYNTVANKVPSVDLKKKRSIDQKEDEKIDSKPNQEIKIPKNKKVRERGINEEQKQEIIKLFSVHIQEPDFDLEVKLEQLKTKGVNSPRRNFYKTLYTEYKLFSN